MEINIIINTKFNKDDKVSLIKYIAKNKTIPCPFCNKYKELISDIECDACNSSGVIAGVHIDGEIVSGTVVSIDISNALQSEDGSSIAYVIAVDRKDESEDTTTITIPEGELITLEEAEEKLENFNKLNNAE